MKRRLLNISVYTIFFIIMLSVFGYLGSVFSELNSMDLYHCSSTEVGKEFAAPSEEEMLADSQEAEAARMTKGYITKSMADSGILNDVKVDYGEKMYYMQDHCRWYNSGNTGWK